VGSFISSSLLSLLKLPSPIAHVPTCPGRSRAGGSLPQGYRIRYFFHNTLFSLILSLHKPPSRNEETQEGKKEEELRSSFSSGSFTFVFL
jgi:hypothetical protein